jgi:glutamine amidotransferase
MMDVGRSRLPAQATAAGTCTSRHRRALSMIVIVDYGMGNLRSVEKGFARVGHAAVVTNDPDVVASATRIVLPGVGAFADAIAEIRRRGLDEPLRAAIGQGKPFLGICLGLQLLFDVSFEDGQHQGLGILPGRVVRFASADAAPAAACSGASPASATLSAAACAAPPVSSALKIPHMGWNQIRIRRRAPILAGLPDGAYVYFVHSYYVVPDDPSLVATETLYPDPFASMVWRDNLFATQFHPEKSQAVGLQILKNFAEC